MTISWPNKIESGKVRNDYVSATDILPTVSALVNMQLNDQTLDGVDLLKPTTDRLLVWKWQKNWAVRQGDWKLTNAKENHWKSRPSDQYIAPIRDDHTLKLFNLKDDPGERTDLSAKYPDIVKSLETQYQDWCSNNIGNY